MAARPLAVSFFKVAGTAAPEEAEDSEAAEGPRRGAHFAPEARRDWLVRAPRRGPGGGLAGWPAVASVSLLAIVLSWRSEAWRPVVAGLSSWQSGVALAFLHHLQWGAQVVFTFGPYGFVEDILPVSHLTGALALAYVLAMSWGLAALVVAALREAWGLLPAGAAAWAVLAIAGNFVEAPELGLGLALGLCLAAARSRSSPGEPARGLGRLGPVRGRLTRGRGGPSSRRRLVLVALLGALAGFQLAVEIDVGVATAWLAAVSALGTGPRRSRAALVAGASLAGTFLVAWAAAGQSLANLPSYFRSSWSVVAGYSSAMSASSGRQAEDYFAVVDLALLAAVFALALRGRPFAEKATISLGLLGWAWAALKEGFVRHDLHDLVFFSLALVALALARLPRGLVALQACAVAVAASLACVARGEVPPEVASPFEGAQALYREVRDLAVAADWARVQKRAHETVLYTGDHLSQAALRALKGRSVAAAPVDDTIAFAYPSLRWDPEPVLQSYSAYTSYLDHLDANFLSSKGAPERILYQPFAIDHRDPAWDPPAAMVAMYCNYSPLHVRGGEWQLLWRSGDACGAPHFLAQVSTHFGQWAPFPPARQGDMLVATFSMSTPLSARVENVLLKPPEVHVEIEGLDGQVASYRFVTGTAGDLHALSVPASLGYPATLLPLAAKRARFVGGGWGSGGGHILITFYALPVHRAGLR